ncbi:MAG: invasion associated locus B family protein [Gammaproteobacteria bacterium]|nr:invasion associated locus B family protein [Gammaproteobacteria bacterium]
MMRGSILFLLAAMFALPAQAAETRRDNFGDWGYVCQAPENEAGDVDESKESCNLFQTALLNNSQGEGELPEDGARQQRLLLTRVGYIGDNERPVLLVTAPLGILLTQGITVSVDGLEEPARFAVQRCDAGGCLAYTAMNEEIVSAFKKGTKAQVTFYDPQRRAINVPLSLKGFTKGMSELNASRD